MSDLKTYNLSELGERNGIKSSLIWIAYKGLIYDVTSSDLFAGGSMVGFLRVANAMMAHGAV